MTLPYPYRPLGLSLISKMNTPQLKYLNLRMDFFFLNRGLKKEEHVVWDKELASLLATSLCGVRQVQILFPLPRDKSDLRMMETIPKLFPETTERVQLLVVGYEIMKEWFRSVEVSSRVECAVGSALVLVG